MDQARWNELKGKGQWDIMVAMRGPDAHSSDAMKWYTTSVLRGQMSGIYRVGGLVNTDLNLVVLPAGYDGDSDGSWNWEHFTSHVATAAQWISVPILYITSNVWHKAMKKSISGAGRVILAEAEEAAAELRYPKINPAHVAELARHLKESRIQ